MRVPGEAIPSATYRLQLTSDFGFDDAARIVPFLSRLGVSHVYLSPILRAGRHSRHGYDVVDPTTVSAELGGEDGLGRLVAALHEHGMGAVVDVVPNHMGIPVPESDNGALWSVLREGRRSPYADWFDIEWTPATPPATRPQVRLPLLGQHLSACLRDGELLVDPTGAEPVLRYYDHVLPLAPGTADLPLEDLLARQHYRLAYWRTASEVYGYRRFFDITTLLAVRVERPEVFDATHHTLIRLVERGWIDGLRIDHPDGLADPAGYLRRLASATGGCWTVVEKILGPSEQLPENWPCAGTTGYDALRVVNGVLLDGTGFAALVAWHAALTGAPEDFAVVAEAAKREAVERTFAGEIAKLAELVRAACQSSITLRDHTDAELRAAIGALVVACPLYRAYVTPGEDVPETSRRLLVDAAERAASTLPTYRAAAVRLVRDLALGDRPAGDDTDEAAAREFVVRFQQCCGAVTAKGVEDTAYYRWNPLAALNEVGGDPSDPVVSPVSFHQYCARLAADWPATMTTLSTHDTKRSEDVRARLLVLAELPRLWRRAVARWQALAEPHRPAGRRVDAETEYVLWQTLVGCWPITERRLTDYLRKAVREAKTHTSWTDPVPSYEDAVCDHARAVLGDSRLRDDLAAFVDSIAPWACANSLSQRLVALTMPGVPDVYQGTELFSFSLVDPDNRRPVDFGTRDALLSELDDGTLGTTTHDPPRTDDVEKLLVTAGALRLRRRHPDWFGPESGYTPLLAHGEAAKHALAFLRGDSVVTVATRLPAGLAHEGGWRDTTVTLPAGDWRDVLTGTRHTAGAVPLRDLMGRLPVALLTREDSDR